SPTATFSATASATPTDTPTVTLTPTATPSSTITWTFSPSPTITQTPVPVPHQVRLVAYNAAGEQVKLIYEGPAQYLPGHLQLSAEAILTGGAPLLISFPGVFATGSNQVGSAATNDGGQVVEGGTYI